MVIVICWTSVVSFIILKVIDLTIGLRVPLHEELLGADLVEHSVKGSFDKSTGEWYDVSGNVILKIDETSKESYRNSLRRLRAILNEEDELAGEEVVTSAFGFRRSMRRTARRSNRDRKDEASYANTNNTNNSANEIDGNGRDHIPSVAYSVQRGKTHVVDNDPDVIAQSDVFVEVNCKE